VPAAKRFLERRLDDRRFKYLYLDGTNFHVRRTTVGIEPTLVVVGVDELDRKSVLAMVQGAKEDKGCWQMVFDDIKQRGLDAGAVQLAVMDGLTGLEDAFREAFPTARALRCWVHKARNVLPRVPTRYQAELKRAWDAIQYADGEPAARAAYAALVAQFGKACPEAVENLGRDIEALLAHYAFPKEHWDALRTTNPIERVNKELKRRSRAMEQVSPDGLRALLASPRCGWSSAGSRRRWAPTSSPISATASTPIRSGSRPSRTRWSTENNVKKQMNRHARSRFGHKILYTTSTFARFSSVTPSFTTASTLPR
jgi:hypothetical protein